MWVVASERVRLWVVFGVLFAGMVMLSLAPAVESAEAELPAVELLK
jgi:hypothetical protein